MLLNIFQLTKIFFIKNVKFFNNVNVSYIQISEKLTKQTFANITQIREPRRARRSQ